MRLMMSCPHAGLGIATIDKKGLNFELLHPTASMLDAHAGLAPMQIPALYALWVYGGRDLCVIDHRGKVIVRVILPPIAGETPQPPLIWDYHGCFVGETCVYVVNTIQASIFRFNHDWKLLETWSCFPDPGEVPYDPVHLNCCWEWQGRLYTTAFLDPTNGVPEPEAWRKESAGVITLWKNGKPEVVMDGFSDPHNVQIFGIEGMVCDSIKSDLVVIERHQNGWRRQKTYHFERGYARGLCCTRQGVFVGLSGSRSHPQQHAELALIEPGGNLQKWQLPVREVFDIIEVKDV